MPLAPAETFYHIGKARKEVRIKFVPEDLANRMDSCKTFDEAIVKEYKVKRVIRLTRDNIKDIAKILGVKIEMTSLMGETKVETLNLKQLQRKGVRLIIVEDKDSNKGDYNIREVLHELFTHITGSGMFIGKDSAPQGVLLTEECFLLLEEGH